VDLVGIGRARDVILQESDNVMMVSLGRNVTRESVHVIRNVPVGMVVEEDFAKPVTPFPSSQEERRLISLVLSIPICSVGQEELDTIRTVNGSRPLEIDKIAESVLGHFENRGHNEREIQIQASRMFCKSLTWSAVFPLLSAALTSH